MQKKNYIMLGRTGDIINILPAVKYEADINGYKPKLIVSQDYQDILDGVTYLEKVIFPKSYQHILDAIMFARRNFHQEKIINCSVYGKNYSYKKQCASFQRESWRFTQCPIAWDNDLPLIFDNRSGERESQLIGQYKTNKKLILTALGGVSSPFPHRELLLNYLRSELDHSEYQLLDITDLKAERIYDLLALYERAHCLIASDSAPLHLAKAVKDLPVVSLISDLKDSWHQSSWRKTHILRLLYSELPEKLDKVVHATKYGFLSCIPDIHLVTTSAEGNEDTKRRNSLARQSWVYERHVNGLGRWYHHEYQTSAIPKVHDMIEHACHNSTDPNSIIVITNADINFVPGITGWILHEVERHGAVFLHRHDFQRIGSHLISEAQVAEGKWYPGSDTFAFKRKWWDEHKTIFPDMYFAREYWDMIFRNMIKRSGGAEIHNAIYHEKHPSFWEARENRNCKENLHNKALAQNWLDTYGGDWNDWKIKRPYK